MGNCKCCKSNMLNTALMHPAAVAVLPAGDEEGGAAGDEEGGGGGVLMSFFDLLEGFFLPPPPSQDQSLPIFCFFSGLRTWLCWLYIELFCDLRRKEEEWGKWFLYKLYVKIIVYH